MRPLPLAAAGLCLLAALAPAAAPPPRGDSRPEALVVLGPDRPLLVHLRLRVGSESPAARHAAFLDRVFRHLDRDGDGVIDAREAERLPPPSAFGGFGAAPAGPRPGKMTRAARSKRS